MVEKVDVAIIGAGPGGCTFAILAAQAGLKVVVVERETFPRQKIGESLLPNNTPLFKRLGLFDRIDNGPFQKKPGAVFTHEESKFSREIRFRDAFECKANYSYQVERAAFDCLFVERAKEVGVDVRQPANVVEVVGDKDKVHGFIYKDAEGEKHSIHATLTIDASGRAIFLAKSLSHVERDPILNQSSAYAYFNRFTASPIAEPGDIEIIQTEGAWSWLIPLSANHVSVGMVWTKEAIKAQANSLTAMYHKGLAESRVLRERLAGAEQIGDVTSVADFSYCVQPAWGHGWLCIGDAAVFVDPVFSSGVMLSTVSAERAFDLVEDQLKAGITPTLEKFDIYQKWLDQGLRRFKSYIYGYYTPGFQKVFYSDPPFHAFRRAVASNLAGNVFTPSRMTRLWTSFFWWNVRRENRKLGFRSPYPGLS